MREFMRIGSGHDTHRLQEGYPLWLGGVRIDYPKGLVGHSDADVVLHAITDAILGALAWGDIGDLYPDTDPQYKGCDSSKFLLETIQRANRSGWEVVNLDVTIFAQEPKLGPLKQQIRSRVAELLSVSIEQVSIKAKTGERVGHIGRGEAIGCHAVILLTALGAASKV
jgi:2-C-methyl-D-erythritol 2,4-cyclodiphosphate synthase